MKIKSKKKLLVIRDDNGAVRKVKRPVKEETLKELRELLGEGVNVEECIVQIEFDDWMKILKISIIHEDGTETFIN